MAVRLNQVALNHAENLIKEGKYVLDDRDAWSEHQPSAEQENRYIEEHGFDEYSRWYLGIDDEQKKDNKGRYKFPYGDFEKVHRCGVLSAESRAGSKSTATYAGPGSCPRHAGGGVAIGVSRATAHVWSKLWMTSAGRSPTRRSAKEPPSMTGLGSALESWNTSSPMRRWISSRALSCTRCHYLAGICSPTRTRLPNCTNGVYCCRYIATNSTIRARSAPPGRAAWSAPWRAPLQTRLRHALDWIREHL